MGLTNTTTEMALPSRKWRVRTRGEEVRTFILSNVEKHPDISRLTSDHFGITRQATSKHLQKLVAEGALALEGRTRDRKYKLAPLLEWHRLYMINRDLQEDLVWSKDIAPVLGYR